MPGLIEYGRILTSASAFNLLCYVVLAKMYEENLASYKDVAEKGKTCPGLLGPHVENHWFYRATLTVSSDCGPRSCSTSNQLCILKQVLN